MGQYVGFFVLVVVAVVIAVAIAGSIRAKSFHLGLPDQ